MGIPVKSVTVSVTTLITADIPRCFDTETFFKNMTLKPEPCVLEEQLKELEQAGLTDAQAREVIDFTEWGEITDVDIEMEDDEEPTYDYWHELPVGWFCQVRCDGDHWYWVEKTDSCQGTLIGWAHTNVMAVGAMEAIRCAQDVNPHEAEGVE